MYFPFSPVIWREVQQAAPPWFFSTAAFVFGAVAGSFLNVCIHRMPRNESLVAPRSHCGSCGHVIRWFDNIPLISFFVLGGKCRDCGALFSVRYWIVECLTAFLFVWIWRSFEPWQAAAYTVFVCGLIVATFIDFEHYIIPDEITIGGILAGVIFSGVEPSLQGAESHTAGAFWSLTGAAIGWAALWAVVEIGKRIFGIKKVVLSEPTGLVLVKEGLRIGETLDLWEEIFSRQTDVLSFDATGVSLGEKTWEKARIRVNWRQVRVEDETFELSEIGELKATTRVLNVPREAMGFGDVKFIAAVGAFLGPKAIFFVILASSVIGSLAGLATIFLGKKQWGMRLPYGPYLAFAAILWLAGGSRLFSSYLGWFD